MNQTYISSNYISACDSQFQTTLEGKICKFCQFYDEKIANKKDTLKHCLSCMGQYHIMWVDGFDSANHVNDYIREEVNKGVLTFRERMTKHFGI